MVLILYSFSTGLLLSSAGVFLGQVDIDVVVPSYVNMI